MSDERHEHAERLNGKNWDEFFTQDRERARLEFAIARTARIMVTAEQHSAIHAEALREYRKALDDRRALLVRRVAEAHAKA